MPNLQAPTALCLLTNERRDIFGGTPSSSVAPLGPDPSFLLLREFSREEVGGSISPSVSSRNWDKMKEKKKINNNKKKGTGGRDISQLFQSKEKKKSVNSRHSAQKVSAKTQPPNKGLSQLYLASGISCQGLTNSAWWEYGITECNPGLCCRERSVQQSAGWRETHPGVAVQVINHLEQR